MCSRFFFNIGGDQKSILLCASFGIDTINIMRPMVALQKSSVGPGCFNHLPSGVSGSFSNIDTFRKHYFQALFLLLFCFVLIGGEEGWFLNRVAQQLRLALKFKFCCLSLLSTGSINCATTTCCVENVVEICWSLSILAAFT